jgi:hypothetical protein
MNSYFLLLCLERSPARGSSIVLRFESAATELADQLTRGAVVGQIGMGIVGRTASAGVVLAGAVDGWLGVGANRGMDANFGAIVADAAVFLPPVRSVVASPFAVQTCLGECGPQGGDRWIAVGRLLLKALEDDAFQIGWDAGVNLRRRDGLPIRMRQEHFHRVRFFKRRMAGEHVIGDATQGVNIAAGICRGVARGLLGGHEQWRAGDRALLSERDIIVGDDGLS